MYIHSLLVVIITNIFVNHNKTVKLQGKNVIKIKANPLPNLSTRFVVQHYAHPPPKTKAFLDETVGGPLNNI